MLKAVNSTSLTPNPRRPLSSNVINDGDRRLRRIARAGRQWKQTIGRKVDMEGKNARALALRDAHWRP